MMERKGKIITLTTLAVLFLISLGLGTYFLLNKKTSHITLDKYVEIINWCDTSFLSDEKLTIDCEALLLNIETQIETEDTCFYIQVITKDNNFRDVSICENAQKFSYTDEILKYKKLMPVSISLNYTQNKQTQGHFSFATASFAKLSQTYMQNTVNEKISQLVAFDPSTTTIKNSVDFCPLPSTLPNYVTEENKDKYTEFFYKNIMTKEDYNDPYLYNWDDGAIRILFACDSAENMGYTDICNKSKIQNLNKLEKGVQNIGILPEWGRSMNETDATLLKEISLIYDHMYLLKQPNPIVNLSLLKDLINTVEVSSNLNEEVFCGMYNLYNLNIGNKPNTENYINTTVTNNLSFISTSLCSTLVDKTTVDPNGLFLKIMLIAKDSNLYLQSQCSNLNNYLNK